MTFTEKLADLRKSAALPSRFQRCIMNNGLEVDNAPVRFHGTTTLNRFLHTAVHAYNNRWAHALTT